MRAGEVVQIRVNPRDCMSVVDVVKKSGAMVQGMSFPQAVSLALSSLCQAARDMKIIPERDGFEFSEMMKPFENKTRTSRKLAISDTFQKMGSDIQVVMPRGGRVRPEPTAEQRRAEIKWKELAFRKEQDPLNWSEVDEQEFNRQIAIASGDAPADVSGQTREPK